VSEKKEDVEFRELKQLLLKFEKNAPNISSDFDLSGYEELIESSNNNIQLGSDATSTATSTGGEASSSGGEEKRPAKKKQSGKIVEDRSALAQTDYQFFVMDEDDSLLEVSRKTAETGRLSRRLKNSFSTTSSSEAGSSSSSSTTTGSSDEEAATGQSVEGDSTTSEECARKRSSSEETSSSSGSSSSGSSGVGGGSIDLDNLFNGVQGRQVKNSRRLKKRAVRVSVVSKRPCLKNLTNGIVAVGEGVERKWTTGVKNEQVRSGRV
jgi:hypothetical protein